MDDVDLMGRKKPETGESTVVLDPRMEQRRVEVLEEENRRRRHRFLWIAVPLLVLATLFVLSYTSLLDVDGVEVTGTDRTPEAEVRDTAGIGPGDRMLTLDGARAEREVEALPWVADADVVRGWPGTVRIVVTERTPAAAVATPEPNVFAWVDETGRVLQVGGHPADGLVTVVGLEAVPPPGSELPAEAHDALAIAAAAPERVPGALATISIDLEAELAEGARGAGAKVYFRNGDAIDEKLVGLDTVLSDVDVSCLATVDLWVPDVPTLTRHPGC